MAKPSFDGLIRALKACGMLNQQRLPTYWPLRRVWTDDSGSTVGSRWVFYARGSQRGAILLFRSTIGRGSGDRLDPIVLAPNTVT
jgi:hypothetical protein